MNTITKKFAQDIIKGHGYGVAPSAVEALARIALASLEGKTELFTAHHAPIVTDEMRNLIKAEAMAELLKDAHDYAPLTAEQWGTLVNNWHQTFMGLSGDGDACRAAMLKISGGKNV